MDIEKVDENGCSLLSNALLTGCSRISKQLLDHGAKDPEALSYAIVNRDLHLTSLLLVHGYTQTDTAKTLPLNDPIYNLIAKYFSGVVDIHVAACTRNWDVIDRLDVNVVDKHGQTAMHYVASDILGNYVDVMYYLFKRGIDINAKDKQGRTAIVQVRNSRSLRCLLWLGARCNKNDNWSSFVDFLRLIALGLPSRTKKRSKLEDNAWTGFLIENVYDPRILKIIATFLFGH
jgi:ankyrin repeat protein